jgi:hypothetical protein
LLTGESSSTTVTNVPVLTSVDFEEILRHLILHRDIDRQHHGRCGSRLRGRDRGVGRRRHGEVGTTDKDKVVRFQQVGASL